MCFGALSTSERCPVCGRRHPGGPVAQCVGWVVAAEAPSLDRELERYLRSHEARFFAWLAEHAPASRQRL